MKHNHTNMGFTLIELMIVVSVVAILASVAYPSYLNHIIKTHRSDAMANMLDLSSILEKRYTEIGHYGDASLAYTVSPKEGGSVRYNFTVTSTGGTATTRTGYTIIATPTSIQSDSECGALQITHTGNKCVTNSGLKCANGNAAARAAVAACW